MISKLDQHNQNGNSKQWSEESTVHLYGCFLTVCVECTFTAVVTDLTEISPLEGKNDNAKKGKINRKVKLVHTTTLLILRGEKYSYYQRGENQSKNSQPKIAVKKTAAKLKRGSNIKKVN